VLHLQLNLTATATAESGESVVWYNAATGGNVVVVPYSLEPLHIMQKL
jgi:hypothetical protein